MDIEKLITLVYGQRCLWDMSDSTYHLRDYQRRSWREISEEIKIPEDELKKKWRGLRDTFGRELKRMTMKKSGLASDKESNSKWPFFKLLLFLRGTMARKNLTGNTPETVENIDLNEYTFSTNMSTASDYSPSPTGPLSQNYEQTSNITLKSPLKKKTKRQKSYDIDAKLLKMEKLKCLREKVNDSDAQFLMSLLPFLRDVPKHRKLVVRANLQQILIQEQSINIISGGYCL